MERLKQYLIAGLVIGACLAGVSPQASAHSLWLNATEYSPKFREGAGAASKLYLGWGHHFPVDDFIRPGWVDEYVLIGSDGKTEQVKPEQNGFLETEVWFKRQGLYTVAVARNPVNYPAVYSRQFSKSLIKVGTVAAGVVAKPAGHALEIIPLVNPYTLNGGYGQVLPVKVLFNGKPAQSCRIFATYKGFSAQDDSAYSTTTDSEGVARIRITHWGVWLLRVNIKTPGAPEIGDPLKETSYTASLTFEVE